jgi:hypothetical protein
MNQVAATLTEEDLARWRLAQARMHAIERKPCSFGVSEVEQAYVSMARLMGELCARYAIDDARNWVVSGYTGMIYYSD